MILYWRFRFLFIIDILTVFSSVSCQEYNLYGDAGHAYALEVNIGHPYQKLNVLVDTGSTTMAIASHATPDCNKFFDSKNSTSVYNSEKEIHASYSQGMWVGKIASDYVYFPSLPYIPEVRSDFALITKSHKFFMNESGWQGLLGLAYLPIGAWGDSVLVESWIESVNRKLNKEMSFQMKLCGIKSSNNATLYGRFDIIDDQTHNNNKNASFRTPILRKRWYEVGVIAIRVLKENKVSSEKSLEQNITSDELISIEIEMCLKLNAEKSIVDSGSTNIRLPNLLFRKVVDEIRKAAQKANILILDEFWYHGEAACWPEPQEWSLPWLGIDLLSEQSDFQYFTLEIPPQSYMRLMSAHNSSSDSGSVSEFCYKLGIETSEKETVLGYTAMEGFQVLFNRSAGWIGFQTSDCGPNVRISGPYDANTSLTAYCKLVRPVSDIAVSTKAAQWALCSVLTIAIGVLVYLLAPCVKMWMTRPLQNTTQISLSQAVLVEQEAA